MPIDLVETPDLFQQEEDKRKAITLSQQKASGELEVIDEPDDNPIDEDEPDLKAKGKSEKTDTPAPAKPQEGNVEIDGTIYTKAQLKEAIQLKNSGLQKAYTQSRQEISEKTKAFMDGIEKLKADNQGDDQLLRVIDLFAQDHQELEALKGKQQSLDDMTQAQQDRQMIEKQKKEVEKKYKIQLPDVDSPDFRPFVDLVLNGNKLEMAYLLKKSMEGDEDEPSKPAKPRLAARGRPESDTVDTERRQRILDKAGKWGVDKAMVEQFL